MMATYTMQLREYIEGFSQHIPNLSHSERIEQGRRYLFDFDYPLFDEEYRKDFETHFIRHFYMREIGSETEGQFKFRLETWLLINMPYFNQLFESELIKYDPLTNSEMNTSHSKITDTEQADKRNQKENIQSEGSRDTDTTQQVNSENDDFARQIYSDTPDSRLQLTANDGEGVIEYATNITETNSNGKTQSDSDIHSNEDTASESNRNLDDTYQSDINENEQFTQHRKGKIGVMTYPRMIKQYRESFLRIEKQIFDEMERLFMLVY